MASSKGWQSIILAVSVICALNFLFKNNPREVVQINVFEGWWYPYSGRDISIARKLSGKVFLEAANYQLKIDFVREYQAIERGTEGTRDKVGVEVKDLYARILVAICSAESISQRIRRLRDEELQPQLIELLKGFMRNWRIITCWNCMKLKTKSCLE
ncbi:uncharacterized protein LOC133735548 isoform X7 [Rosa rugosa]|uniref:uncharacterized protein LOC133735548 isoform X7 n=1 Tax=Rosa rugosa TaxID=74645 RepID=UPI002B410E03|nr:uncharacterized protein LOC133735548 isoform X7 [Rosa rugosa]